MNNYFLRLMDALEQIERSIFKINDLKREFEYQVNKLVNRQALIAAAVGPALFLIIYTINGSGMFSSNILNESATIVGLRMFGVGFVTWTLGVLLDFTFKYLFYRDYLPAGRTTKRKKLAPAYKEKKQKLVESVKPVVEQELVNSEIPEDYLDIPTVGMLMQYINDGRAKNLNEAVQLIQKDKDAANLKQQQSLIRKFKEIEQEDFLTDVKAG